MGLYKFKRVSSYTVMLMLIAYTTSVHHSPSVKEWSVYVMPLRRNRMRKESLVNKT